MHHKVSCASCALGVLTLVAAIQDFEVLCLSENAKIHKRFHDNILVTSRDGLVISKPHPSVSRRVWLERQVDCLHDQNCRPAKCTRSTAASPEGSLLHAYRHTVQ